MIGPTGLFHKMWRGHNREPIFADPCDKDAYLSHLKETYSDDVRSEVKWFSFCLMGNHTHETGGLVPTAEGSIKPSQVTFSDWMRSAHSRFGAEFNRRHDRQGKVAYDRPKTKGIDDDESVLTVMFYGDANLVAAGLVAHPSHYREYSSYRYYAFGERSAITEALTSPPAYWALGKTAKERQRAYRKMCDEYLRNRGFLDDRPSDPRIDAEGENASGCSGSTLISDDNSAALVDDVNARGAPTVLSYSFPEIGEQCLVPCVKYDVTRQSHDRKLHISRPQLSTRYPVTPSTNWGVLCVRRGSRFQEM